MNKINKLILLADATLLPLLVNGLSREPNLEILLADSKPENILSFISNPNISGESPVILVDQGIPVVESIFFGTVSKRGFPVMVITTSVKEGFACLAQGATDMVVRHSALESDADAFFYRTLSIQIQTVGKKNSQDRQREVQDVSGKPSGRIIAIGSSTGGTETVLRILKQMPKNAPPILIVQHMPPVFTKMYAERANAVCTIDVWEARDGDRLENGLALIAPGDFHMTLTKVNGHYQVACNKGEKVCGQCPSVDILFESVADTAKADAVGVILTGMGSDGAIGLLKMHKQGAYTIGQDKETSVVYGMPRAAYEMGALNVQLPLEQIPGEILAHIR